MNKKAKNRIFRTVMATKPLHCQTPWYEVRLKKLILMLTKYPGKYIYKGNGATHSEESIISKLSYDAEEAKRWQRTPEQIEEDARLEQSVGLLCGNPNA